VGDCGSFGCTGSDGPDEVLLSKETPADLAIVDGVDEPVNSFFFSGSVTSSYALLELIGLSCSSLRCPNLNGVDPAFEAKLAGFWPNNEPDAAFSDVEVSSFPSATGADLLRLKRLVDVVDLWSAAFGENRPPLDWLGCENWKSELERSGFSICDDESNGFGENRLLDVVGDSVGLEGEPKLNSGFDAGALPEAFSLCDFPANRLANGFLGAASSLGWVPSVVVGSSVGLEVSSAGDARPNNEPGVDDDSTGFDGEPNKLVLDSCEDGAVPAA